MRQLYDTVKSGYITEESNSFSVAVFYTVVSGKNSVIIELQTEPAIIFHGIPFLLEQLTNWLLKLGFVVSIFSKMKEMTLSLQGKHSIFCRW